MRMAVADGGGAVGFAFPRIAFGIVLRNAASCTPSDNFRHMGLCGTGGIRDYCYEVVPHKQLGSLKKPIKFKNNILIDFG